MRLEFYRVGNKLKVAVHNPADPNNVAHVEIERDGVALNETFCAQYQNQIDAFKASEGRG